jgi:hypothetical protein
LGKISAMRFENGWHAPQVAAHVFGECGTGRQQAEHENDGT